MIRDKTRRAAIIARPHEASEVLSATSERGSSAPKDECDPIERDTLNKWWQPFARATELPKGDHYEWRSCRRGFANRLHRVRVALKDLQGLGGWKTAATLVEVYLQADQEAQRRALQSRLSRPAVDVV